MPATVTIDGRVGLVRMDWPDRRNALGPQQARELTSALVEAADQSDVMVLAGSRAAFCSGGDLKAIVDLARRGPDAIRESIYGDFQNLFRTVRGLQAVTIAAIDGPAVGLGADLALACDHRYFGSNAWIAQGWTGIGAIPGTGGAWLATRIGGPVAAWELVMNQGRLNPDRLERLGLGICAADPDAESTALSAAHHLTEMPPAVLRAYKELLNSASTQTYHDHLQQCLHYQTQFLTGDDFFKRADAILNRRNR
jgi:enoyl-CoA hydratase/carnithine racemase